MNGESKVVIIIGLPGSGKTTYSKTLSDTYEIHDDFIFNFFNGEVIKSIRNNRKVCLNDPRLCNISVFCKYMKKILKYISTDDIKLILYENDIEKCRNNIIRRGDYGNIEYNLNDFSSAYDINYYISYNHDIFSVYE
uniref:AAA domain protein n=1 Tax=Pithovirus LCPAC102 TaxID=2506587 RepID=A0A481Z365_9VIRU|nr:MAG: AAA domain protein [Pithovirus LCPAC102]